MRSHSGSNLDELFTLVVAKETGHEDPIGDERYIRSRLEIAFNRFSVRQDDWEAAERIARDAAKGEPDRGLVAHVYKGIRAKARPREDRRRSERPPADARLAQAAPTLEELDAERREQERRKVRGLRSGPVKKKLL